jgi:hypothetical protein
MLPKLLSVKNTVVNFYVLICRGSPRKMNKIMDANKIGLISFSIIANISLAAQVENGNQVAPLTNIDLHVSNSSRFINVMQVDGNYVVEPLLTSDQCDPQIALENTRRIHRVMTSGKIASHCLIYFPPGDYYFDGAAPEGGGTIESSDSYQTFAGAGMNTTRLLQKNRTVPSTIRLRHDGCSVQSLFIGSADQSDQWNEEWERNPHAGAAIHLDAPVSQGQKWTCDPTITNVNINSLGNTIALQGYCRPFRTGIKVSGSWLNIYVHTVWMTDLYTGIEVDQGPVMAGPAKFIDVNFYSTHEWQKSVMWSVFFKSICHFMEQVELIHCTYIGSQFIYMDGHPLPDDPSNSTPCYNMVIDHNYINVYDTFRAPEAKLADPKYSGIYLNLPPRDKGDGNYAYSRDIRFTNNTCIGRAPSDGAFFYVEGMCRGITFSGNDVSSAYAARCIYLRPLPSVPSSWNQNVPFVSLRDVKITNNYFRNWPTIATIGKGIPHLLNSNSGGEMDSQAWIDRVIISGNQSMSECDSAPDTCEKYLNQSEMLMLFGCRDISIDSNTFAKTGKSALLMRNIEGGTISGNIFGGFNFAKPNYGIAVTKSSRLSIIGNVLSEFQNGMELNDSEDLIVSQNSIYHMETGLSCGGSRRSLFSDNSILQAEIAVKMSNPCDLQIRNNIIKASKLYEGESPLFELKENKIY